MLKRIMLGGVSSIASRIFLIVGASNAQAELRGLMFSRRAAVSSSLWLDRRVIH